MTKDWVCSVGNVLGGSSVGDVSCPKESVKWSLDLTEERFEGIELCTFDGCMYLPSYFDGKTFIRSIDIVTGAEVWKHSYDFGQHTQLCVSEKHITFGFLVLDRHTGKIVFDLREVCGLESESGMGFTQVVGAHVIKTYSGFDTDDGYCDYDTETKKCNKLPYKGMIYCSGYDFVLGKKDNLVSMYSVVSGELRWEHILPEPDEDPFACIAANRKLVFIKNTNNLHVLDSISGEKVKSFSEQKLSELTSIDVSLDSSVSLYCSEQYLIVWREKGADSWIILISLNDYSLVINKKIPLTDCCCLAGDYLFTIDEEHNPIALSLPDLEPCWKGEKPITSHKVIAGSNHVVYAFPGGGFQCYGPANE